MKIEMIRCNWIWSGPSLMFFLSYSIITFFFEPHLVLVRLVNDCYLSWILISYYPFLRGSFCHIVVTITRLISWKIVWYVLKLKSQISMFGSKNNCECSYFVILNLILNMQTVPSNHQTQTVHTRGRLEFNVVLLHLKG